MSDNKYQRQIQFFGTEGQKILKDLSIVIVGVGGIGSHVVQQLAFLGVGRIIVVDNDDMDETSLNRLVGVSDKDVIGTRKVDIAERNIKSINSQVSVQKIHENVVSPNGFNVMGMADCVFGCVDNDGTRLIINEFCQAYELPYIDLASGIQDEGLEYGGRIVAMMDGKGCLHCVKEIDPEEAGRDLEGSDARDDREAIYGVSMSGLEDSGPSVVSLNGIIASLAVTEFMLHFTGKRNANFRIHYMGKRGIATINQNLPDYLNCYYCKHVRGLGEAAKLERYLNMNTVTKESSD